jgi:hypothetical protein
LTARSELKQQLVQQLGGKCTRCGYDEFIAALDFHHIQDDKESTVANLLLAAVVYKKASMEAVLAEAQKCILLCANCHRRFHALAWNLADET